MKGELEAEKSRDSSKKKASQVSDWLRCLDL